MQTTEMGIAAAAQALHQGDLSALEYATTLLAQAAKYSSLNAFIQHEPDLVLTAARQADASRARGDALGPLHGIPLALKDNLDTAGVATTGGTPGLRGNVPGRNAPVVQKLLDAGAIVFGKANLHELAYGITTNNATFGASRNPWDPSRIPGGSSGGTAVAVAARIVPAGIGTDTGGSVRVPAALCGIVGFRPTTGLWSTVGVVPISHTRDTPGPMARSVADCALLHQIVVGSTLATSASLAPNAVVLKGVRLGIPRGHFWDNLDAEVAQLCEAVLGRLRTAGAILIEADVPNAGALDNAAGFPIALYETVSDLNVYLREHGSQLDYAALVAQCASADMAGLLQGLAGAGAIPPSVYQHAIQTDRPALQRAYADYFRSHQVEAMVFPSTPLPASKIGEDDTVMLNGVQVPTFGTFIRNSSPSSVAGIPGISLPVGLTRARLPVGIELDAPAEQDQRLLQIAQALEALLPAMPAPH